MAAVTSFFGTIRSRLLVGMTALVVIPLVLLAVILGFASLRQAETALTQRSYDQMQSIREGKREEIRAYFAASADNLAVIAATADVREALTAMPAALTALGEVAEADLARMRAAVEDYWRNQYGAEYMRRNPEATLALEPLLAGLPAETIVAQYLYIASNPNPLGEKGALDRAEDESEYSRLHARVHPLGRRAVAEYGLYDLFLFDLDGRLVYSYFKELDYATRMVDGPWRHTGLAQAFNLSRSGREVGEVAMTDYAPYGPSYDDQAVFLSTPVFAEGRQIGVLALQLPIDRVNAVMTFGGKWQDVGLGASGEAYLVGADHTPRSISRFVNQDPQAFVNALGADIGAEVRQSILSRKTNVGVLPINTQGVSEALAGRSGVGVYPDYRGTPVLGAYAPLDVLGQRFALLSEIDVEESGAPVKALRDQITLIVLVALSLMGLIGGLFALRLARSINDPLAQFGGVVDKVTKGDRSVRVRMRSGDEIGQLADAFDSMLDERNAVQERIEKENNDLNNSVVEIMTAVAELANRDLTIKVPVSENVTGAVADAINMMSRSTASALGKVQSISGAVSKASGLVRKRAEQVQQVAKSATGQATSAAAEIQQTAVALQRMGREASEANQQAERALKSTADALDLVRATVGGISTSRDQIRETEKRVKRLAERSQEISSIVGIIGQIAERTSVLALNASMQAVAAGDAGRGFAVVADEVKRLAENARQATQQIGSLVTAIQADTSETLQAMNGTIAQVVDISRLADRAGGQMDETRAATEQLVFAVRSIGGALQTQSQSSQTLLSRAYELLQSSQQTIEEIDAQREDAETLAGSASELVTTVGQFRLPTVA